MGGRPKQTFLQRRHTGGQKAHENMFVTNYQINANQNYEISPHNRQNAIIKKLTNYKCWRGYGEKGTLLHCWWECKLVQTLWRTVQRFLIKVIILLPCDPAIPLLDIYLEKAIIRKDTCILMFIAALFAIAKTRKQPKCPLAWNE